MASLGLLGALGGLGKGASQAGQTWQQETLRKQREKRKMAAEKRLQERGWKREDQRYERKREDQLSDYERKLKDEREAADRKQDQMLETYREKQEIKQEFGEKEGAWEVINHPELGYVQRNTRTGETKAVEAGAGSAYGGADSDAPTVKSFYDRETGQPYKAQWDAEAGEWKRIGGAKAASGSGSDGLAPHDIANEMWDRGRQYLDQGNDFATWGEDKQAKLRVMSNEATKLYLQNPELGLNGAWRKTVEDYEKQQAERNPAPKPAEEESEPGWFSGLLGLGGDRAKTDPNRPQPPQDNTAQQGNSPSPQTPNVPQAVNPTPQRAQGRQGASQQSGETVGRGPTRARAGRLEQIQGMSEQELSRLDLAELTPAELEAVIQRGQELQNGG